MTEPTTPAAPPPAEQAPAVEGRGDRFNRHAQRTRLYLQAFLAIAMLVVLIALILANTRSVKLSWVFGDTHSSLIWIIVVPAILGWLLGLATSALLRRRTRRPH